MTTVTETRRETTRTDYLSCPVPVEMVEDDGFGQSWMNLSGEWLKIVALKNLWKIDEQDSGRQQSIRMHFRAITEDNQRVELFQDLLEGRWYRQITLDNRIFRQPTPIYQA